MQKIIKFGFLPIKNDWIRGQNDKKGKKLFESGHVLNVVETEESGKPVTITCSVVAQTSVSNVYSVKIVLNNNRHITDATCTCKAGLSGQCKHICAAVHFINSPESGATKTNYSQGWGKLSHRQLLGYDKGARISSLFPPPPLCSEARKLQPYKVSTESLGKSLADTPLYTMLKFDEENGSEIIATESLVEMKRIADKQNLQEKARKVGSEILTLQQVNNVYWTESSIEQQLYDFYEEKVCCDINKALSISVDTIDQSTNSKWFQERKLRITASTAHKVKGNRFDISKVITGLLNPEKLEISAMFYGKKKEKSALEAYKKLLSPGCEVVKVGLIVNIFQSWLCCSPDSILVYGPNIWKKRLIEIKCPYVCRNQPAFDGSSSKVNVKYVKFDENGFQLNKTHSIWAILRKSSVPCAH